MATTFKSFSEGIRGKLKGKRAVRKFDRSVDESLDGVFGTRSKKSKKSKKTSKAKNRRR